ncbi:MAG: hypothetical protein ACNI3C_11550 [Candidatus Marinarcus sp.]|uniref:hypothetical protein n=1 Tax=Candidatus Marinarcus sp. TaxID=3100987 RepID=UPI003B001C54
MYECDVVYIQGNPKSGLLQQHLDMEASIIQLIDCYSYKIIDSMQNNRYEMKSIPEARVYIGFSRGSRYLNKLHKNRLKLSIGGIKGKGINHFIHTDDKIHLGDLSLKSLDAHFKIEQSDKIKIELLLKTFLNHKSPN